MKEDSTDIMGERPVQTSARRRGVFKFREDVVASPNQDGTIELCLISHDLIVQLLLV